MKNFRPSLLLLLLLIFTRAHAQTIDIIHQFQSHNNIGGGQPLASVTQGTDGTLYGTTSATVTDYGTAYMVTTNGTFTRTALFMGTNGYNPASPLVQAPDGNLYGTTVNGGSDWTGGIGSGTVFRLTTNGILTRIASFAGTGATNPIGSLVLIGGNLYGTTINGGSTIHFGGSSPGTPAGTIFRCNTNGTLTIIGFFNGNNGANPYSGLIRGSDGLLYGTTWQGGTGTAGSLVYIGYNGVAYRATTNGSITKLGDFSVSFDFGYHPYAGLTEAPDHSFYGTTVDYPGIFRVTTNGTLTRITNFPGSIGYEPRGTMILGTDGSFYGTLAGGDGGIYKFSTNGTLISLIHFSGSAPEGKSSWAGLTLATDGNFYGVTRYTDGTLFRLNRGAYLQTIAHTNTEIRLTGINIGGTGTIVTTASTNLIDWLPLQTNLDTSTPIQATDPTPNLPHRYYRLEQR